MSSKKRQGRVNTNSNKPATSTNNNNNHHQHRKDEPLLQRDMFALQKRVTDFLTSSDDVLILPDLSNTHRKYLHKFAAREGLKTRSHGPPENRILHIRRPKKSVVLGPTHKFELTPAARELLHSSIPNNTSAAQLSAAHLHQLKQPNGHCGGNKSNRNRPEPSFIPLCQRMIPPPPKPISDKLYRDKQELPISRYRQDILQMLKQHSIFIVNGETGSGKTTQVPQYILEEATRENQPCRVIVTQPRRVAAVSVAHRIAEERGEQLCNSVGYQIRLEKRYSKTTNLIYTTSGCVLRSIMNDMNDFFSKVTHLIIDEIHERDKFTDFTLITVKEQLKKNKNLKVILMSATMDIQLLSRYFDDCPVVNVPGQGFDVMIYHLEDILYHTGYHTLLMDKYMRVMGQTEQAKPIPVDEDACVVEGCLQDMLNEVLDQCCEKNKSEDELAELFDQIQYYIESEGMPVNAGHSLTRITPLMAACKFNFPKYVEFLMYHRANIYLRDAQGFAAMDYALMHADGTCASILNTFSQKLDAKTKVSEEDAEKLRILDAYQRQCPDENDVDHDLILSLLEGLYRSPHPGAIMVFLPGYSDIVQQRDLIQSTLPSGTYRICILHSQMDSKDQFEALQHLPTIRKIILSTNIGQTSITIPDLAYIIDSGKVKMKTFDSITESSQLRSVWISQADANQRSGRAGRTQNGICYRLYPLARYESMSKFCIPEFMRIPLTEICLYAKTLDKNCDIQTYLLRALNPPSSINVQNAIRKLKMLQVLNDDESITNLGKHLVDIPLDVQLGICLLYSIYLKCFDPILTIVAYHTVKEPFVLPTDRSLQGQASKMRKSFSAQTFSDHMGILMLYKAYTPVRNNRKRLRDFCTKYYVSQSSMEMFMATRRQIADLVSQKYRLGVQATLFNDDWNMVRYCLAAGIYPNLAAVNRNKIALECAAQNSLIIARTSSLNPPGMKNLKEYIDRLPHDWLIYYEKGRVRNGCTVNMNTVIPPIIVALQCGHICSLNSNDDDSDASSSDEEDCIPLNAPTVNASPSPFHEVLTSLSIADNEEGKSIMSIDNWIRFEMPAADAEKLYDLRIYIETQFWSFLNNGHTTQTSTAAYCVQKLLNSLEDTRAAGMKS